MSCRCQPFKQHPDCPIHVASIARGVELASSSFPGGAGMAKAVLELAACASGRPEDLADRELFIQREQDAGLGRRAGEYDAFAEKPVMREVTLEYLTELQNKADSLTAVRRWIDAELRTGSTDLSLRLMHTALERKYGPLS